MDWSEARDRSVQQWRTIYAAIGERDPNELILWVQAAYGLCEKAKEIAEERAMLGSVCPLCLAHQQQGGCLELREWLVAALLEGELAEARALTETLIANLEELAIPGGG